MLVSEVLVSKFDFNKFKDTCQEHSCEEYAKSKAIFKEIDIKRQRTRELVEIRLCREHIDGCKELSRELNKAPMEYKIIRVDISPLNQV